MLLKNDGNALPLKKPASLALIGQDAIVNPSGANACTDRGVILELWLWYV